MTSDKITNNHKNPYYLGRLQDIIDPDAQYGMYYIHKEMKYFEEEDLNSGDIITLDMIEPYESIAVRKVADYINENLCPEVMPDRGWFIDHAKEIVVLVHEAEDADE